MGHCNLLFVQRISLWIDSQRHFNRSALEILPRNGFTAIKYWEFYRTYMGQRFAKFSQRVVGIMTVCFYFHFVVVADLINVSHFLGFSSSSPGRVGLNFLPFDLVPKTFFSHLPFLPFFSPSLIQPLSNILLFLISYSPLLLLSQTIL